MHPLDTWRKDQGYTLKQAAEFLEVPFPTLTDWIYCRRFPRGGNVSRIEIKTCGEVTGGDLHAAWLKHHHPDHGQAVESAASEIADHDGETMRAVKAELDQMKAEG